MLLLDSTMALLARCSERAPVYASAIMSPNRSRSRAFRWANVVHHLPDNILNRFRITDGGIRVASENS